MALGGLNHLGFTVTDMAVSAKFYDAILGFMGYQRFPISKPDSELIIWFKPGMGGLTISPSNPDSPNRAHDRYSPGLHHLAFDADSRDEVDRGHALLQEIGATILDPPAAYDYSPNYYAVFFADPDGLKLELCHTPLP